MPSAIKPPSSLRGTALYVHHDQQGATRLLTSSTGAKEVSVEGMAQRQEPVLPDAAWQPPICNACNFILSAPARQAGCAP
jgi:hypothetical protein